MGKKIDSIKIMYALGLPAPRCVFIMKDDKLGSKLDEYFTTIGCNSNYYTIRTDKEDSTMSHKRLLTANMTEITNLSHDWREEGFQIILQEFIDERNEVKSGNMYLTDNRIIIEGAMDKHIRFTNGWSLDVNLSVPRFGSFSYDTHRFFINQTCLSCSEIMRLVRLARRIPYTNAVVEFSYFSDGRLYFWEIKKERSKS